MAAGIKVLGIFGSPRRGGNTDRLLEKALEGAKQEGAEIERVYPSEMHITPCTECLNCLREGKCILQDDMQGVYEKLIESDILIVASPVFFYGVTAWTKALIDRCQVFWAKRYVLRDPLFGEEGKRRRGFFISVGGSQGPKVFDGAILTVKYFFDVLKAEYTGELVFRKVDEKGDILKQPEALRQAFEVGKKLVSDFRNRA